MQFITTDQRIAVENFEVGLIYTVTFSNGDSFTGACIGIGPDFVAFQRTAPKLLFCLTMTTAADVAIIEPLPADIGQIIEYTGSVPVSIKTDGSPLLDYLITGNTIQNGTPTPDSPIIPQGCGELETGQYKIPILSGGTTTPVYLGGVQTTRAVKKVDLGTLNWIKTTSGNFWAKTEISDCRAVGNVATGNAICTHFTEVAANSVANTAYSFSSCLNTSARPFINKTGFENLTVEEFKQAMSGVYVWYVLATPQTAVVNEPLMRIGDYADTLSYRQSGVNIPTTDGLDIFDIDTTVKPSEVYLKYFSPLF